MTKSNSYLNKSQLGSKIGSIRTSAKAISANVQTVLVNACGHAFDHKNVSYFTRALEALGNTGNRQALISWAEAYGLARWDAKANAFKLGGKNWTEATERFEDGATYVAAIEALNVQWDAVTDAEPAEKPAMILADDINKLVQRYEKACVKSPERMREVEKTALVGALKALEGLMPLIAQTVVAHEAAEAAKAKAAEPVDLLEAAAEVIDQPQTGDVASREALEELARRQSTRPIVNRTKSVNRSEAAAKRKAA